MSTIFSQSFQNVIIESTVVKTQRSKQQFSHNNKYIYFVIRSILSDLKRAVKVWPDDLELHLVLETLQLSQDALLVNPAELAGQLVGRIHGTNSSNLITQAKDMLAQGKLPAEALPILNLLEAFEIQNEEKTKVRITDVKFQDWTITKFKMWPIF